MKGICIFSNNHGFAILTETNNKLKITLRLSGLPSGKHGFHLHQFGNMKDGCKSMGTHYNPTNKKHGGLTTKIRHLGDFGNIIVNQHGNNSTSFTTNLKLKKIIGRGLVIHADEDDLGLGNYSDSDTTGHSGERITCGIIAIMED